MCVRVPTNLIIYSFFFYRNLTPPLLSFSSPLLFLISSSFSGTSATLFTTSFWSEESLVVVLSSSEGDFSRDCSGERSAELLSSSIRMRTEGLERRTSCCSFRFFFLRDWFFHLSDSVEFLAASTETFVDESHHWYFTGV